MQCRLETKELWDKFHDLGTEMIITKSGRYEPECMLTDRNNRPCPVCSMTLSQTEKGYPPAIEHVRVPQTILSEKGEYRVLVYILINF